MRKIPCGLSFRVLAFVSLQAATVGQEDLYVIEGQYLRALDPSTASEEWSIHFFGIGQAHFFRGMASDGARLTLLDLATQSPPEDYLYRLHPGDGSLDLVGLTGENWNNAAIDVHPQTGVIYAAYLQDLFIVDPNTGQVSFHAIVDGLKGSDCICSMAIHPNGTAYASGIASGNPLYEIDLATGTAQHLGDIPELKGVGEFYDLAFSSQGELWGYHNGGVAGGFTVFSGLYRIDHVNVTAQLVSKPPGGYSGIAFGPATPETFYCTPKTGSTGCQPKIRAEGVASPTATFGYEVSAENVRNNTIGMLLYSTNGAASNPFGGGTLCLAPPHRRTALVASGGTPPPAKDCSGRWSYDLNAHFSAKPGPAPGDTVNCQWIGRDGGFAPANAYALSDALELTLLP